MRFRLFQPGVALNELGVPPCGRAYFLLLRQKKVAAKEKATPGYAVGCADSPALLEGPGGCGTRPCWPQTVLADIPRPFPVARRSTWGPGKASRSEGSAQETKTRFFNGRALETARNNLYQFGGDAFRVPMGGAEQRRLSGGLRLALSEPQASLASRPDCRVAQGIPAGDADPGGAFFFGYFLLGEARRKYARPQGGTPS
jgi:hypothetical protein